MKRNQAEQTRAVDGLEKAKENNGRLDSMEVLGYHMRIAGEELIGDALFSFLEAKKVMVSNMVSCGATPELYDNNPYGQPWKLHTPMANRLPYPQKDEIEADASIFRFSERELRFLTPNLIEPLEAAWEALQMAGIRLDELHRKRVGVFVAGYSPGLPTMSYPDETALRGTLMTSMADQVSYWLGTHGPSMTLDTACASSLTAVTAALNSLRNGSCEVALVIASTRNSEMYELMLQNAGVVSPKGECKPFDEDASGTIRCEGRACLVLSTSTWARENHHKSICRLLNSVMASAGADPGSIVGSGRVFEAPNGSGISEMIKLCHDQIGLPFSSIQYFEAHATGTVVGDLVELEAIRSVYGDSLRDVPLKIGSIKGNIGHGESSAGLYGVIKVIEMFRKRHFLPSGGCTMPRRDFDWTSANMEVCQTAKAFPVGSPVCVGIDSFGVGGSYGFAILTEAISRKESLGGNGASLGPGIPLPVQISAASAEHLEKLEMDLVRYMKECHPNFVDLCGSITLNRPKLLVSRNYLVRSMDDFIKQLDGPEKPVMCEGHAKSRIAFAFTGQGAQWKNMGDKLMIFRSYREAVEAVDGEFRRLAGWSILKAMAVEDPKALDSTRLAQPATFTIQVGLCELLKYFGITPSIVFGHSAGEVAALYCGGYISLHAAVKIVYLRSVAQETLAGCGRMMAISMSRSDIDTLLIQNKDKVPNCEVACVNSPHAVVVGGPENELLFLKRCLPSACKSTLLQGNIAFHTSKMDSILGTLEKKLLKMPWQSEVSPLQVPFVSSVTGRLMNDPITQTYFLHNIRQPVQFGKAVEAIVYNCEFEMGAVVEIGPHRTLIPLINETLGSMGISPSDVQVMHALQRGEDDCSMIYNLLMKLMNANVAVDLRRFYQDCGYSYTEVMRYSLPVHPILRKSYKQYISRSRASKITYSYDVGPAAGCLESGSPLRTRVEISTATCPLMLDHVMGGNAILPGMYYVEALLESVSLRGGHFHGVTLSDVSFDAICPIPDRNKGSNPVVLMVKLSKDISEPQNFTVVSKENLHSTDENPTVHCTGAVMVQSFFNESGDLHESGMIVDPVGNYMPYELKDIGIEGLEALKAEHGPSAGGVCHEHRLIYDVINRRKDHVYYGESFQVVQRYSSNRTGNGVAELHFHHKEWSKAKGKYGIQLLDGIAQLGFLDPRNSGGSGYFKGFDACHFVRLPEHDIMYAYIICRGEISKGGREVVFGDVYLYDPLGRLVLQIFGLKTTTAKQDEEVLSGQFIWQPFIAPVQKQIEQPEPCSQALAAVVLEMAHSKADYLGQNRPPSNDHGPVVIRVLEYCVDVEEGPRLLQSLLSTDSHPVGVVIEIVLATNNAEVAHKYSSVPKSKRDWLLLRVACLPMAQLKVQSMSYCAVCLWKSAVMSLWSEPAAALGEAVSVSCPGAILFCDVENPGSEYSKSVESFLRSPVVSNKVGLSGNVVQCQLRIGMERPTSSKDHVMVLSSDRLMGEALKEQLVSKMQTFEDQVDCVTPITEDETEGYSEFIGTLEKFLMEETQGVVRHVVFLDPALDTSRYAKKSFLMIPKLGLIIQRIQEKSGRGGDAKIRLWLVSSNIYNPPINIDHCGILPFPNICFEELALVQCHLVDTDRSSMDLDRVASLILLRPVERLLVVHAEGVWRICGAESRKEHKRVMVGPDDESLMHSCNLYYDNGKLRHEFFATCPPCPGEGEVLVNIHSSSMNFRDLMLTLDALSEESFNGSFFGRNLGMECAGIVAAAGDGVSHIRRGDRVMLSAPCCFASKVTSPASRVLKVPDTMSLESAAAIQSVYMTAYHALINLARVKEGERVLIHAAAGGVGHAAISICQYLGAEVYATTSEQKRGYVESLGVHKSRIFNSRNVSWYEDLMTASGEGVDVVLNSLAKEHQKLCLQALRPGGRMCEIGKVDIYDKNNLNLFPFRRNISFHAIDMDRMMTENPGAVHSICEKVIEHLFTGDFRLIPHCSFPMGDLDRAFDLMRSGKHRGKIVLNNVDPDTGNPIRVESKATLQFGPDECALVAGATGGMGYELVHWLFNKGTRKFLVTARNDPSRIHSLYSDLISKGAEFEILCLDLSKSADLDTLASHCKTFRHPLRTIVHAAGNYLPTLLPDVNEKILFDHLSLKNDLAAALHRVSLESSTVNYFFIVGSTSSMAPAKGAACYGASNAILAGLARERIRLGLPCTLLHMTAVNDVGIVSKQSDIAEFFVSTGVASIPSSRAIADLESMAINGLHETVHMQKVNSVLSQDTFSANSAWKVPMMFGQCSKKLQLELVTSVEDVAEFLVESIKEICGIDGTISLQSVIVDLGMDSMGLLEFERQVAEKYQISTDRSILTKSVLEMAKSITKSLKSLTNRSNDDGGGATGRNAAGRTIDNDGDSTLVAVGPATQTDPSNNAMSDILLSFHRELQDPTSYLIIIPGVTGDPRPFNSWLIPGVQIYVVNLSRQQDGTVTSIAGTVSQEMKRCGLLSSKTSISILGFSFGSMVGFHLCGMLVTEYGIEPSKFLAVSSPPPNVSIRPSLKQSLLSCVRMLGFNNDGGTIFDILRLSSEELQEEMLLLDEKEREKMYQIVQNRLSNVHEYIMRTSKQRKPLFVCNHMEIRSFVGGKDNSCQSKFLKGWKRYTKGKVCQHKYELCGHYIPTDPYVADDFQNTVKNIIRNV